jgi:hypothetical protein
VAWLAPTAFMTSLRQGTRTAGGVWGWSKRTDFRFFALEVYSE